MDFFKDIGEILSTSEYMSYIWSGLKTTLIVSLGAAALGMLLGMLVAIIKISAQTNKKLKVP